MVDIDNFLIQRKKRGLLRTLNPASLRRQGSIFFKKRKLIDFSSNDYLCLSGHKKISQAVNKTLKKYSFGACASRLLSGDTEIIHKLENETALFKQKPSALIFNSGYQANIGILSALFSRNDVIFMDKLSHASLVDGAILSRAKILRFDHNDYDHLDYLLKNNRNKFNNSAIVTETVFSMDGDVAELKTIIQMKKKYNCMLVADEAHATGIFGKNGAGIIDQQNIAGDVDIIIGTFSKALGSFGAYAAVAENIKNYLVNTCRSFIYSTALPLPVIEANREALRIVKNEPFRRKKLLENAEYFRIKLKEIGLKTNSQSQIVPVIIGKTEECVKISRALELKGYWAMPIRPPAVEKGKARLRFSLSYSHSREVLNNLLQDLKKIV